MVSIAKGWKIWEINHLKCKVTESFLQITGTILWNNVQWWIIYNKTMNSVCVDSSVLNRLYWIKWVMNCHVLHLRNKGFKAITSNTYSSTVYWELNDLRLVSSDICANGFKDRSSSTSYLHDQTVRSVLQGICLLNHIKQLKTSRTLCTHTYTHTLRDVWMPDVSTQQNYENRTMNQQIRHDTVWGLRKNSWVQRFLNGTPTSHFARTDASYEQKLIFSLESYWYSLTPMKNIRHL